MKNLKKISLLILLVVALVAAIVVSATAEGEYTGTVADLSVKVNAAVNAADDAARLNALVSVADYLAATPVDPAAEGYADVKATLNAQAILCANALLASVEDTEVTSTANNQVAVNNLNYFLKLGLCDTESDAYKTLVADFEAREALQAAAKEANRQAMLNAGALSAYDLVTCINNNCDTANPFPTVGNLGSNVVGPSDGSLRVSYGAQDTQNTFVQYNFASGITQQGVVVDFDFTTFGSLPPNGFHIEGGGHAGYGTPTQSITDQLNGYPKIYPSYLRISDTGNLTSGDHQGREVLLEGAVVKGEWIHITVIFNNADFTFSIYAEYEHLATVDARAYGLTYDLSAVRFSASTKAVSEWSVDNVQVYQGTALRDLGMFDRMSDPELFVYYANYYMNDDSNDTIGRYSSFKHVSGSLSTYLAEDDSFIPFENDLGLSDEDYQQLLSDVESAARAVKAYDQSAFEAKLAVVNRDTFISYVQELKEVGRVLSSENISARNTAITKIESFILGIEGIIEEDDAYDAAVAEYGELYNSCFVDENILNFNRQMSRYEMVDTLVALEKYYDKATDILNDESYPIDPALAELEGFEDFAAAYAVYLGASDRIDLMKRDQNSKKIVSCLEIVQSYAPETWLENYDLINPYVVMIRDTIVSGYYNPDYVGVDVAIETFEPIDDYFYLLLQEVHIAELTARLDYVYNNDAYIEKMGTLSYIERYLENNDIDYTNEEIAVLVANYNTAIEELAFREVDYETVLKQNANYFISLVEKMRISDGFNEKKALYDSAIGFYFALDATVDGAREAIAVFDEHTLWFEKVDEASNLFLSSVAILQAATTEDEKYAALVDCYLYSLDAELTYDGVAAALEIFNAEYEAYNSDANAINEAVAGVGVTVGSVRANCGVSSIIAVIIKKIFE